MADRSRGIDGGTRAIGQANGSSLSTGTAARESPDQRRSAFVEDIRSACNRIVEAGRSAVDTRNGIRWPLGKRCKPRFRELARALGVDESATDKGYAKVVANAATHRAGHVGKCLRRLILTLFQFILVELTCGSAQIAQR